MHHAVIPKHRARDMLSAASQRWLLLLAAAALFTIAFSAHASAADKAAQPAPYFPDRWNWETRQPAQMGLDAARLEEAIQFAKDHESDRPKDLAQTIAINISAEPYSDLIGPTKPRGELNGIILRNGYIVAEWGDTRRVDMTFSVTKTYLSTTAALALDRGLIRDVQDKVKGYVRDGGFDSPHNAKITWHQLLNQTSEWEGTLWDKPDWADRWNGTMRVLQEPGSRYQYNDVRVNRLALALLEVWRRPLPRVLREEVMDPIGASNTWRWHGYRNSWVEIDGAKVQSVSGGGHWGGGMWISTRDHARFGLLFANRGRWNGRQLVSEKWVELASKPTDVQPTYGYMNWFLNTGQKRWPSAPESSIMFLGAGTNMVWIDPEHDLVSVVRWINGGDIDGYVQRVLAAVEASGS